MQLDHWKAYEVGLFVHRPIWAPSFVAAVGLVPFLMLGAVVSTGTPATVTMPDGALA